MKQLIKSKPEVATAVIMAIGALVAIVAINLSDNGPPPEYSRGEGEPVAEEVTPYTNAQVCSADLADIYDTMIVDQSAAARIYGVNDPRFRFLIGVRGQYMTEVYQIGEAAAMDNAISAVWDACHNRFLSMYGG